MDNQTEEVIRYRVESPEDQLEDDLEPPFVIAVQGSTESGKTTLIKSLVYHFTKQKINSLKGTVTLRTNKNQRITFLECPTNMQAMVDVAKIADLALLLIDASIGFEMETFEFLCLLHNHGMPNVMGVLTHLDYFKLNKHARKTKKRMKKRFWKEVFDGAKLFYFSGIQADGSYPKTEVNNLCRFISVQKIKVLSWRSQHSYMVCDKFDVVETQDQDTHNLVSFYGYVRGTYLDRHQRIHINGLGDFEVDALTKIDDPCPIEFKRTVKEKQKLHAIEKATGIMSKSARTLKDKDKVVYAPFSNLGSLNFEKATGYITIPDQQVIYSRPDGGQQADMDEGNEGQKMVWKLQDFNKTFKEDEESDEDDFQDQEMQLLPGIGIQEKRHAGTRRLMKPDADMKILNIDEAFKRKEKEDQQTMFKEREVESLFKLIYESPQDQTTLATANEDMIDSNRYDVNPTRLNRFRNAALKKHLKSRFVTGQTQDQIVKNLLNMSDSDGEMDIDKEQLRNLEANDTKIDKKGKKKKRLENEGKNVDDSGSEIDSDADNNKPQGEVSGIYASAETGRKKGEEKKKEVVIEHGALKKTQDELRKVQFLGEKYGHFKCGTYIRVEVKLDKQISRKLEPEYPVVLCSLKHQETNMAYVRVKIKKHRWYPHVLKTKDPLTVSIGWRKFQSIPVYTMEDESGTSDAQMRMIKYTPKFGFCYAVFYSPTYAVGTTLLGIQSVADTPETSHFRICATGVVVELNTRFKVMKKLKLIGEPEKVHRNTAFIRGMFNSNIEAAKFTGAQLRTVSGIRGTIKRITNNGQPGTFRATFEDKILKSDLVFCKTWYQVDVPHFCNPIVAYGKTRMLKTHAELRKERDLPIPSKKDSQYVEHDDDLDRARAERVFAGLTVPKGIEANLPFKQKQRAQVMNDAGDIDKRRQQNLLNSLSLPTKRPFKQQFMNQTDKKVHTMIQRLAMLDRTYSKEKDVKTGIAREKAKKRDAKVQEKRDANKKEAKKKEYKKKQYEASKPGKYDR